MNYRECAEWLSNHDNILLLTHIRPDGDTLGSASALCSALRRCGKKAALYKNPDITPKYMKYIEQYVDANFAYDCVVAVDVAEKHMFPMGFTGEAAMMGYALILAINRPIEMLVTSLNCVGDSVAAITVARSEGKLDEQIYNA